MASTTKIALITGGSRGLGKSMALHLAARGTDVLLTYNTKKDEAAAVVAQIQALGRRAAALQLDAGNTKSFDAFFAAVSTELKSAFGTDRFDFLVNNAGIGIGSPIADTTEDQFDQLMNIHFKGVYFLTQKALPHINDGGRIINLSSGLARFSMKGYSAYGAMKGAVETLTRYMAIELGERQITVNVVAPGAIETDFGGGYLKSNPQLNKYIADATALGRVGQPDDVGSVVAFLCSDDARWVNGQRIEVAGGIYL